jgi:hypothetical protein
VPTDGLETLVIKKVGHVGHVNHDIAAKQYFLNASFL